jgi:hypothetical protein
MSHDHVGVRVALVDQGGSDADRVRSALLDALMIDSVTRFDSTDRYSMLLRAVM